MGPILNLKKSLVMGLFFKSFWDANSEAQKVLKNWWIFVKKWKEMDTSFQKNPWIWIPIFGKITPRYGYGLELTATHP